MSLATDHLQVHRTLRGDDARAIGELHRRVYVSEYGMNAAFVRGCGVGVREAVNAGWPQVGGGVWIVEQEGEVRGSLGLTAEGDAVGRVRWFALERSLRGRGLGRRLIAELLDVAREQAMRRLELETFSALTTAGAIYRRAGFELTSERERSDWGATIVYQHYALNL